MTRVGFVGAGRMGAPMVRRLVDAGHEVRALGRTDEKRRGGERTRRAGRSPTWPTSARGADVVIVCVFTDEQVQQVCLDGDLLVRDAARLGRSSSTRPAARDRAAHRRETPAASTSSTRRSAAARTTSPPAR